MKRERETSKHRERNSLSMRINDDKDNEEKEYACNVYTGSPLIKDKISTTSRAIKL